MLIALAAMGGPCVAAMVPSGAASMSAVPNAPFDARSALRVDGWTLSMPVLEVLHRAARARDEKASLAQVAAVAVQDRVLGAYAGEAYGDSTLFDASRVAFSPATTVDSVLTATLRAAYGAPMAAAFGDDGGERFIARHHALTRERLAELLDSGKQLRLDDRLSLQQEESLKRVALIDFRFDGDGALQRITLHDVWQQLDVQGRNALYRLDAPFAMQQARQLVRDRFVVHWATTQGRLTADDIAQLQQLMLDRQRHMAMARQKGAGGDPHFVSPEIARLRKAIPEEEIRRYYDGHRSDFTRIERVRARHIRCNDEPCIKAAADELAKGASFEDVARRHSVEGNGEPNWIQAVQARNSWLAQFAFAQAPGAPTQPVREPVDASGRGGWVIVKVEERVTGYHEPDSETVRFVAGEAIARKQAADDFAALRDRLLAAASIELNSSRLGFDRAALKWEGSQ